MYLKTLILKDFRSCKDMTIDLQQDLTILVGENNGGKSNILEALRVSTQPLNGRRERYAEDDDIHRGAGANGFKIESHFSGLSDTVKGLLIAAIPDPQQDLAIMGCKYETLASSNRRRLKSWVGKYDGTEPEPGSSELVRHVYLPALRDAHQALGNGGATRIMSLFRHFLATEDEHQFLQHVKRTGTRHDVLARMNSDIGEALESLTGGVRPQSAEINFASERVQDIARDLRFKLGDNGINLDDIRASGLGYSNLLYMSTVVVELAKAQESDLTLFLVEEPEAHLHPQLQMLVLEFLLEEANRSRTRAAVSGQPEGIVQVIVTTHSPNLTAWVSPDRLVVVRSNRTAPTQVACTSCVPIAKLTLTSGVLKKINRYLDVTKSSLLFGGRAILVEGIAEALLLPVFAKHILFKDAAKKAQLARFKGSVLAPIDGVDFKPYVEVLLSMHNGTRIADTLVVITDRDPHLDGNRAEDLTRLATVLGAKDHFGVFTNEVTFEHELFKAGNDEFLKSAFLALRTRSADRWKTEIEDADFNARPSAFVRLLETSKTRKGDLAQQMATQIENGAAFIVPDYIVQAMLHISEAPQLNAPTASQPN